MKKAEPARPPNGESSPVIKRFERLDAPDGSTCEKRVVANDCDTPGVSSDTGPLSPLLEETVGPRARISRWLREARASVHSLVSDFTLWQLADSAFPTGGFAHSSGLEAAWQHGEVRNRDELVSFIEAGLQQLAHASLPFVMAAFDLPEQLGELDQLCDVFLTNHVANRASRSQGRAMLSAVERIFPELGICAASLSNGKSAVKHTNVRTPFAHFAPVVGSSFRRPGRRARNHGSNVFLQSSPQRVRGGGPIEHRGPNGSAAAPASSLTQSRGNYPALRNVDPQ